MSLRILDLADKIKLKFRQLPVGKNNTLENYPSEALNKAFDTISKPEFAPDTLVTTNLASLFKQTTAGI